MNCNSDPFVNCNYGRSKKLYFVFVLQGMALKSVYVSEGFGFDNIQHLIDQSNCPTVQTRTLQNIQQSCSQSFTALREQEV